MSIASKCVFNAMDNIREKHPYLSKKDCLDMSVNWCEKRQSDFSNGIEFDCQEYQDLVHPIAEEIIYLEATIDHCGWIVEDIEDFLTEDVAKKPNTKAMQEGKAKKKASTQPARTAKKEIATKKKVTSAKREFSKQEPLAKEILARIPELFEVESPEEYVKVMGELIPTPEISNGVSSFRGREATPNLPMTAVASSVVQGRAVLGDKLYVKFHSSPDKVYKYSMGSNEEAQGAFDEMVQGSPGRWVWNNLRNHKKGDKTKNPDGSKIASKYGAVFGNPSKETIGGIGASNVPYDKSSYNRVKRFMNEMPGFEELAKKMSKFKMEVKAEGDGATSGEPFSQKELGKFQEKMKNEVEVRKSMLDEIRASLKGKGGLKDAKRVAEQLPDTDFTVNDSFDELIAWVQANIASDYKAAKEIAFRIAASRKKRGKKNNGTSEKWEKNWGHLRSEFETLGLKKDNITRSDVKKAYFKTAKETHPDRKGGNAKKFIEATNAHDKLMKEIVPDFIYIYDNITNDSPTDSEGKTGRWITVHGGDDDPETAGTHIFIKKGQTAKEAIDAKFKGKSKSKESKKDKPEAKKPKSEKPEKKEKKEVSSEVKKPDKDPKKPKKDEKVESLDARFKAMKKRHGEENKPKGDPKGDPKKDPKKPDKDNDPVSLEKLFNLPEGVLSQFEPHTIDKFAKRLKAEGKGELPKTKSQLKKQVEQKKELTQLTTEYNKLKAKLEKEAKKPAPKKDPVKKTTEKKVVKKVEKKETPSKTKKETKKPKEKSTIKNKFLKELERRIIAKIRQIARDDDNEKDFRKQDLMEEIYDLEVQLINQGHDIEQIREEYEQWVN